MAEIGDVQRFEATYREQLNRLEEADIDERDREQIRRLVRRRNVEGIQKSTNVGTLNRLRLAAERAHTPLVEFDADDYYALHDALELDHELADGTLRNYRKALKRFAEFVDHVWAEEVVIGESPSANRTIDPSKLLTGEEVAGMLEAANNARDKAIMAMLRDTGIRVGALCNLRLRDVELSPAAGEFTVKNIDGNKEAEGTRPFTWSRGPLVNWLDVHPRREDDDAPLFHKLKTGPDAGPGEALSTAAVRRMLALTARRADIDPGRVNPHNWRDTTFAEWKLDGLSDQQIKHRGFHTEDSDMLSRYGPIDDREMNDAILDHYDIGDGAAARTPDLDQCPQCRTALRDDARFCPTCGLTFDDEAREQLDSFQSEARERTVEKDDAEKRRVLMKLAEAADVEPGAIERLF
jgi:integrase